MLSALGGPSPALVDGRQKRQHCLAPGSPAHPLHFVVEVRDVGSVCGHGKAQTADVKQTPPAIGACERCNAQFKSSNANTAHAELEIMDLFDAHRCQPMDASQA
jgi:hypothetical protein